MADHLERHRRRLTLDRPTTITDTPRLTPAGTPRRIGPGRAHGIRPTYVDGCRCDPCTDAEAAYQRERYRRARARRA